MKKMITRSLKSQVWVCCGLFLMLLVSSASFGQEAPANDLCDGAIEIPLNGELVDADNTDATGDVEGIITCGVAGDTNVENDIWYWFTAPENDGIVTIETLAGTNTDTQVQVLDACGGEVVGCDDDGGDGFMSLVEITCGTLNPGEPYFIQIDGWGGASGTFQISLTSEDCPSCTPASQLLTEIDDAGCADEEPSFSVLVSLSDDGTAEEYTITNDLDDQSAVIMADGSASFSFPSGSAVSFTATATGFPECQVSGFVAFSCPPANDDCDNAIEVGLNGELIDADNSSANGDENGVIECGVIGETAVQSDLWYWFTAPDPDESVRIETIAGSNGDTQIQVLDACGGEVIACDDDGGDGFMSLVEIACGTLTPGQVYFLQVDGWGSAVGTFQISLTSTPCQDPCVSPELGLQAFEIGGQEPISECLDAGTPWVVSLGVLGGEGNAAYDILINGEDSGQDVLAGGSTIVGGFVAGDNPEISIVGQDNADCGASGLIGVEECPPPGPENDDCAGALEVEVDGPNGLGDNSAASGDPDGSIECGVAGDNSVDNDVWFRFTAPDGSVRLETIAGSNTDTQMQVLDACDGAVVGCDDDGGEGFMSLIEFECEDLIPGNEYFVQVDGWGGSSGTFELSITSGECFDCEEEQANIGDPCDDGDESTENDVYGDDCQCAGTPIPVAPENDLICNAAPAACGDVIDGTTIDASNDEVGTCGTTNTAPGVWYNLPIDFNGSVNVSTCNNANYDTKISVFNAEDCESELECIGGNDDGSGCSGFTSDLTVNVSEGQNLYILVHGFSQASGDFTLSITCEVVLPCEDTEYNLVVDGGIFDSEVSWNLLNENSEIVADGGAPITDEVLCLADGCYTLEMFDSFGDGWNGNEFSLFLGDELVAGPFTIEDGDAGIAEFGLGDVVCGQPDCESYEYYYADILEDGTTNIYQVVLSGTDAILTLVATSDYEVHIAFNEEDGLIYAVSKLDGSFRTLDPIAGVFGPVNLLDQVVSEIVGATFNPDGKLMILSQSENTIYSVMLGANAVSVFDSYSPSLGGDIDFANEALYLATREGFGSLYIAVPDQIASDIYVGTAPQLVTGIADTEFGNLIFSHRDATNFMVRSYAGAPGTPYNLLLNDQPFMSFNGDLASGCADNRQPLEPCNYALYYVHVPTSGDRELIEVTLNGDGTTTNNTIFVNPPNNHIGLTPDGSTLYMVGNGNVNTFDINSASVTNTASIALADGSGLSGFPAAVVGADGVLYAGNSGNSQVYTIDPVSGLATPFGPSVSVNGGDLIFAPTGDEGAAELWIITRNNNTFTRVADGVSFTVDVSEINGAATLENGNVLLADGNGAGLFKEVQLSDGAVVAEYETGLALHNGDLAGGCTSGEGNDNGDIEPPVQVVENDNTLSSYPNPTNGPSVAIFTTGSTERATLEVYDMNGRLVQELFSGVAESGVEYRVDFDGLSLPNGVYMYRLTTNSETTVTKFMIAR